MKRKFLLSIIFSFTLLALTAKSAKAYMYSGGQSQKQIVIDKTIKAVNESDWQDNLSAEKIAFAAEDLIDFKIIVKNSGKDELKNIAVIDYFPRYVNFIFGPGTYSKEGHKLEWKIDQLAAGEEKEFRLRVSIVSASQLPKASATFAVINTAKATADSGESDEDTAQFYIETRILSAKSLPEAGTSIVLGTIVSLVVAGIGIVARKFGRGEIL